MISIQSLPLIPELKLVIQELGFTALTPIQADSLPHLLNGKDLIGKSKTGSGKTLAFALPILNQISLASDGRVNDKSLSAIILCPTRELCAQVTKEIRKLGRQHLGLRVLPLSGGQPMGLQIDALEQGVQIVVGTPGRVLDHLNRRTLDLRKIKTLVLDEADRMLEMGFQEEMEQIMDHLPKLRQTIFFSATYPPSIESLSKQYQTDAVSVTIEETEAAPQIEQFFYESEPSQKLKTLAAILNEYQPESTIVFCNMKITVDEVAHFLKLNGVSAQALHGDLEQSERDRVMVKFRNKSIRVLVATDVAARGIDISALDLVINYDLPKQTEIYVHRIGRTGRAGKTGVALSIILPKETTKIDDIQAETQSFISKKDANFGHAKLDLAAPMATLFIAGGKRDKMRPGDILGALTGEAGGLDGKHIGKIEIFDFFSYVAVSKHLSTLAIQRLQAGKIKGKRFRIEPVR